MRRISSALKGFFTKILRGNCMTARLSFEYKLKLLKENLTEMGKLIEDAIEKTMKVFETQDELLANEIIEGDRTVNDIEKMIEARCLSLILKQQPVARDLRIVTSALKVVTDMERIGDHAVNICEWTEFHETGSVNNIRIL
jgi:phosphate transport system protein